MAAPVTLSLDAMSGDHGPTVVVDAAVSVLKKHPGLHLILVGDETVLARIMSERRASSLGRLTVQHAPDVVGMHELPSKALRSKRESSMRVAINLVKDGRAEAAVSAGNTGALMAMSRFVLKTLPGIDRPAIVSAIPSLYGHTHVLDLGANAECSAEQLFQFAVMGSVMASAVYDIEKPKVGLLNIGEEEIKGNDAIREAATLIQASSLNYIGFVEGDDVFLTNVDVVVCDGFVGNVALKTSEGVAKLLATFLKEEFTANWLHRLAAVAAYPALSNLKKRMDPRRYNGASFVGLNGTVVKSHGSADALAFANAIEVAMREVEQNVPGRINELLGALLPPMPPSESRVG